MVFRRLPLAAFVCVATLAAQSPPLISLQITALDNHGQPVTDLQTADFRIADDGKPQPPVFTRLLAGSQPPAPLKPNEFSNRSGDPVAHSTVILFDLLNADLTERGRSWTEIVQTLQHLESNDHFYLYLLTREATLFPVHPLPANEEPSLFRRCALGQGSGTLVESGHERGQSPGATRAPRGCGRPR